MQFHSYNPLEVPSPGSWDGEYCSVSPLARNQCSSLQGPMSFIRPAQSLGAATLSTLSANAVFIGADQQQLPPNIEDNPQFQPFLAYIHQNLKCFFNAKGEVIGNTSDETCKKVWQTFWAKLPNKYHKAACMAYLRFLQKKQAAASQPVAPATSTSIPWTYIAIPGVILLAGSLYFLL